MVGFRNYGLLLVLIGLSSLYVSTSGDRPTVYRGEEEVFEGDSFEISCVLSFSDSEGWTVNSSLLITEDNDLGYVLSERTLDMVRDEVTLKVQSAQLYHEGEYRCNRFSRDFHYVKVIPLDGSEIETPEKETSMLKTTHEYILEVNKTIEFYCSSAKDENTPISWYKNSRRISENSDSNILIDGLTLIIENAQEDDAGEYMCTIDTPFVTGYTDIGRIFRLNSPPKILDFPERVNIIQGRYLNLHCKAQGFPLPKITWYIGNLMASHLKEEDLRISVYSSDGGLSNSYLIVRDMRMSDKGLYTCRAENSVDSGQTQDFDEDSVFAHVRAVSSIDSTSTTFVKKGGSFTLACEVPIGNMHLWFKDGKPIEKNVANNFRLENQNAYSVEKDEFVTKMLLIVEDADSIHTGVYKCNTDSRHVIVITENMIETNEDEPGLGKLLVPGEPLILQCNTTECPHCTVVWYKDGVQLQSGTGRIEIHQKNNSLIIEDSSYNDTGIYMCAIDRKQLDVALNATIVVQSKIKLDKFDQSAVVVQGSPLELVCSATGSPSPYVKWFIGDQEIFDEDERIKLLDHGSLKRGKLLIEEAEYEDRNYYTCEAYNQVNSINSTVLIRIKGKLAALWPFLGICAEVAILCSIIFVYERRKSMNECDEPVTDLPADDKHRDQKSKGQDIRQRK